MKLIIIDTNIFVRIALGSKRYEKLLDLMPKEKVKVLIHNVILAEALSVLLKAKENELFGKVDKERISLTPGARRDVFEDLVKRVAMLKVDIMDVGKAEVEGIIEKVRDVCISAFDALTLVIANNVKPDLIVTDDRLFRNRALRKRYNMCSEEELFEKLESLGL
ncbi:MAG: hypothetical protein AOA65_0878 [Candidatus Bathyarchaeota archaeon BA1]|nr:MAG: hypothetical protein AOA65_0878 [Candidatus Bathyarchaeota archaeon BA1]